MEFTMENRPIDLSPNEAITLRRIAYGVTNLDSLRPDDIDRLKALLLVEERRSGIVMTQLGRNRIAQLPALRLIVTPQAFDEHVIAFSRVIRRMRLH
jgi:hypothetical protein